MTRFRRVLSLIMTGLLLAGMVGPVGAATEQLDQSQTQHENFQYCKNSYGCAQVFTAGQSGGISRVRLKVERGTGSGDMLVEIRSLSDGLPTGAVLASAVVPEAEVPAASGNPGWVDVTFSPEAPVNAGEKYAIYLAAEGTAEYHWYDTETDTYSQGEEWLQRDVGSPEWDPYPLADFAFETYVVPLQNNAQLSDLSLSQGTLSPAFSSTVYEYTVFLPNSVSSILVTPTTEDPEATVTVNGADPSTPVTLSPGANTIDVVVTAPDGVTTRTYTITATRNSLPTITGLSDQTIPEDGSTGPLPFTIGDAETSADALTVAATSLTPSIVPVSNIVLGGSGADRTISVTPAPDAWGTATIEVQVSDGTDVATATFDVTVTPVNDPPSISPIPDTSVPENEPATISFTVDDPDGALDSLTVTATSSDQSVVPDGNIVVGGSGADRTLTITPAAESGTTTITVTVSDGSLTASTQFDLTLITVNDAPVISGLSDKTILEDTPSFTFTFTVSDEESPASSLSINVISDNPAVVPSGGTVTNDNGSVSVTMYPVADAWGTATITVEVSDGEATSSDSFTLTVTAVNDPPVIGPVADQTTPEDTPVSIGVSVSDVDNDPGTLLLTGTSSNQSLVPNSAIVVTGIGDARTVTITPAKDQYGTVTITLRLNDGIAQTTRSFTLTVTPVNDPPTISDIPDLSVAQNDPISPVSFTVSDPESAPGSLTVTATSSNQALVPDSNLKLGGTGSDRTLSITPASSDTGSTVITVTVSDGELTTSDTFLLTISQRPTISPLSDVITDEDSPVGPVSFTVDDLETPAENLILSATSSNQVLVPNGNIVFGGSGKNRTMTIVPAADQYGTTTITVTVDDGLLTASRSFVLTVNPVNDAPTISPISDLTIPEDTSTGPIAFTVADVETPPGNLIVTATSSNQAVVPNANIMLGGSGTNRTITIVPANEASGTATITITVSDGEITVTESFVLTVTPVDDPPQINAPSNPSVLEDSSVTFSVSVTDVDSPIGNVTLTASSLDQVKVPNANIQLVATGSGTWSVTVTPAPDQSGTVAIRLTASDGNSSFYRDVLLTIIEVNDPPTISSFSNQITDEDVPLVDIPFTVDDIETPADHLKVYASSDNPTLLPSSSFVFGGSGNNRTLTIIPAEDQHGTAGVFVTVDDGTDKVVRSFTVTVNPVPDPPRLKGLSDQTINEDEVLELPVTVYDPDSPISTVTVSFTSSNQALVPDSAIQLTGSGANRTLVITPTQDYSGVTVITATSTGEDGTTVQSFTLTVEPVNDPPIISLIPDQTILEGGATAPIPFTVGDVETPPEGLKVTATASDKAIVPDTHIAIGGSGPTRTITVAPAPDRFGTVTITVTVDDGQDKTTRSFKVNIIGVNDPPSFTVGPDVTVDEDAPPQSITGWATNISAGPFESQGLFFEVTVDDPSLFASPPQVSPTGTLAFTPALDRYGTTTVNVRLRDDGGTENGGVDASDWQSFTITINPVNDLPVISPIPDQGTEEGVPTGRLPFTVTDVETAAGAILVSATSSNQALVPNGNIILGGVNEERWIQVTPVPGRIGTTTITLTADDGEGVSQYSFLLVVNDLKLSALKPSEGEFSPPFSPTTLSYTAIYLGSLTEVTLTPVAVDPAVEILVNGAPVISGTPSPPIPLTSEGGSAEVLVRAPATGLSKTYRVRFLRALSKETKLAHLSVSPGTLTPAFDPAVTQYTVTVDDAVTALTVDARPADGRAKVTVEGHTDLRTSNQVRVLVRAENGEERLYTIGIVRKPGPLQFVGDVAVEAGAEWATLTFETSGSASVTVYYGTAGGQQVSMTSPASTHHAVTLGPLNPATTYTFSVVAQRQDGSSAHYTSLFTTADPPSSAVCLGGEIRAEGPRTVMVRCPSDGDSAKVATQAVRAPAQEGGVTASSVTAVVMNEALRLAGVKGMSGEPATVVIRTAPSGDVQSAVLEHAAVREAVRRGAGLEVRSDRGSLTLPPNVLASLLPEDSGRLVILFDEVEADRDDVKVWINDGQFRQVSSVLDVAVATVYADGRVVHHTRFTEPVRLTLKTDHGMLTSPGLPGLYWLAEDEDGRVTNRVYMGGRLTLDGTAVTADLDHLSTYVALAYVGEFKDVPHSHWAYEVIRQMAARQVIRGTSADLFSPETPITRGQIAAMLVRGLRLQRDERFAYIYKDIRRGDPLAGEIGGAVMAGLMMGYPDGTFHPDAQISRQELAVVLHRVAARFNLAHGVDGTAAALRLAVLQDWDTVAPWAREAVRAAVAQGLMTGRSGVAFAPDGITTRAEAATVVKRLLDWIEGEK